MFGDTAFDDVSSMVNIANSSVVAVKMHCCDEKASELVIDRNNVKR